MAKVMASVAAIVMTTATVLWKEAIVPTMYDKLRVTTTCRQKKQYFIYLYKERKRESLGQRSVLNDHNTRRACPNLKKNIPTLMSFSCLDNFSLVSFTSVVSCLFKSFLVIYW